MSGTQMKEYSQVFLAGQHQLLAYTRAIVKDSHTAEDICQEVWLQLADAVNKGRMIKNIDGWCRTVARNLVLQYWRRQKSAPVFLDHGLLELLEKGFAERQPVAQSYHQAVEACLETLPGRSQSILDMRYRQELPMSQIAASGKTTVAGAKMRLTRIRQALRKCVEERLNREEAET